MIRYKLGDVVLLPSPFTDFSTFKQRPALVISSTRFNWTHGDVIVAAISSHIMASSDKNDYRIPQSDQISAGLPRPSIVKLGKIVTIDQRLIRKRLGALSTKTTSLLLARVVKIFSTT